MNNKKQKLTDIIRDTLVKSGSVKPTNKDVFKTMLEILEPTSLSQHIEKLRK